MTTAPVIPTECHCTRGIIYCPYEGVALGPCPDCNPESLGRDMEYCESCGNEFDLDELTVDENGEELCKECLAESKEEQDEE